MSQTATKGTSKLSDSSSHGSDSTDATDAPPDTRSLDQVLNQINDVAEHHDPLEFGVVMDTVGQQSFAPLLLIPGLIMLAPGPADIPGVPVVLGLLVVIVCVQIIMRREHVWVPQWMERRKVKAERVKNMTSWLRKPAGWMDRLTKKRYARFLNHAGVTVIAVACILIAATTPVLEFVPFSANLAGAAITAFALAIMAKDGLIAGLAILCSLATVGWVAYQLIA